MTPENSLPPGEKENRLLSPVQKVLHQFLTFLGKLDRAPVSSVIVRLMVHYLEAKDSYHKLSTTEIEPESIAEMDVEYQKGLSMDKIVVFQRRIEAYILKHPRDAILGLSQPGLTEDEQQTLIRIICDFLGSRAELLFLEVKNDKSVNIDESLYIYAFQYIRRGR